MKTKPSLLCFLSLALLCGNPRAGAQVHAEAEAKAEGNHSSTFKKTVTVTSDGKNTIKKTVITRNGIEETITEITDENGRVTVDGKLPGGEMNVDGEAGEGRARIDGGRGAGPGRERGDDVTDENTGEDRPWLGARVKETPQVLRDQLDFPEDEGVVVDVVADKGPAAKAGIVPGDVLLRFGGEAVATPAELEAELHGCEVGESVAVDLLRKGQRQEATVILEPRPDDQPRDGAPPQDLQEKADQGGGGGRAEVEVDGNQGGLDAVLDDKNLPEDFKKMVREMKEAMEEFERKQGRH
jgi:hypothetical protein